MAAGAALFAAHPDEVYKYLQERRTPFPTQWEPSSSEWRRRRVGPRSSLKPQDDITVFFLAVFVQSSPR